MFRHRAAVLLVALVLLLFTVPAVSFIPRDRSLVSTNVISAFFVITLLAAVFTASTGWKMGVVAAGLALPVAVLQAVAPIVESGIALVAEYTLTLAFLGLTIGVLLRSIFVRQHVTVDTICAALCVYLLLGVFWAISYSLLDVLEPSASFYSVLREENLERPMRFGGDHSIYPLYFSFVTMTTLGFGDVTPNSPSARMLAALEAVMGQLYLAVLVARLVALHTMYPSPNTENPPGGR